MVLCASARENSKDHLYPLLEFQHSIIDFTNESRNVDLGCVQRVRYVASINYDNCQGGTSTSSASATCSASAATCEAAAFAAAQCAFNAAYALALESVPNCPPA